MSALIPNYLAYNRLRSRSAGGGGGGGSSPGTPLAPTPADNNLGGESGSMAGWTTTVGSITTITSAPQAGTHSFYQNGNQSAWKAYQDFAVPEDMYASVDAGNALLRTHAWDYSNTSTNTSRDICWHYAEFLDESDVSLGDIENPLFPDYFQWPLLWQQQNSGNKPVPANTRTIRMWMEAVRKDGSALNSQLDSMSFRLSTQTQHALTVANNGFETGDFTSWNKVAGTITSYVSDTTTFPSLTGVVGSNFAVFERFGGNSQNEIIRQTFDVPAELIDAVDAGRVRFDSDMLLGRLNGSFTRVNDGLVFYDATGGGGSALESNFNQQGYNRRRQQENVMQREYGAAMLLPVGTRSLKFYLGMTTSNTGTNRMFIDDINMNLWEELV